MKSTYTPIRTCMGCGKTSLLSEMTRVVPTESGKLVLDRLRRAGGRGGYLHHNPECLRAFVGRKGLIRSLRVVADKKIRSEVVAMLKTGAAISKEHIHGA